MQPFTNQAFLSYDGASYASNTTVGQIVDPVTATKISVTPTYSPGSEETFIINLVNSSSLPITNVTVTDNLGGYTFTPAGGTVSTTLYPYEYVDNSLLYYSNGVLQPALTPTATNGLTVTGITIPANGNVSLIYAANTTEYAPLSATESITNSISVTGDNIPAPITAEAVTTPVQTPQLSIVKSLTPQNVTGSEPVTYTFNLINNGSTATATEGNLQITDTFNPPLSNIAVAVNGTPLSPDRYSYDPATGVFSTNPGVITVPEATYVQDATTGAYSATPGETVVTVTGPLNVNT